jgi:hypothetical protein
MAAAVGDLIFAALSGPWSGYLTATLGHPHRLQWRVPLRASRFGSGGLLLIACRIGSWGRLWVGADAGQRPFGRYGEPTL